MADGAFALYNEPSKAFHGGPGHFYPTYKKKPYRKAVVDYTSADWVDTEYLLRAMLIICEYANIIRIVLQFAPVFGSISDIAFIFITRSRYRILYKEPFYKGGKEKPRVPAWCDRILYRSASRLQGGFVPEQVSGTVTHPAAIDKTATQPPAPTQLSRVCVRASACVAVQTYLTQLRCDSGMSARSIWAARSVWRIITKHSTTPCSALIIPRYIKTRCTHYTHNRTH